MIHFDTGSTYTWLPKRFWTKLTNYIKNKGLPCQSTTLAGNLQGYECECIPNKPDPNMPKFFFELTNIEESSSVNSDKVGNPKFTYGPKEYMMA